MSELTNLGFVFKWGALLGWSAIAGVVDWTIALPMYAGSIAWCVMYDTIYAHQVSVRESNTFSNPLVHF